MDYSNDDEIQAAIEYMRLWLEKNNIQLPRMVPMSYINVKYGKQIRQELGLSEWTPLIKIGSYVLKNGIVKLDTYQPEEKFTEKNKRIIDRLIEKMSSDYAQVEVREVKPNYINIITNFEMDSLLKLDMSEKDQIIRTSENMKDAMVKLLGIEIGNPLHGNFDITTRKVTDEEKFIKKINKEIKPAIREIDENKMIRAIKIQIPKIGRGTLVNITLYFNSGDWSKHTKFKGGVKDLLSQKFGYNPELFNVSIR